MTEKEEDYVAQVLAPLVGSPTIIERMGDDLKAMNPQFNREADVGKAIHSKAWTDLETYGVYA